MNPMFAAMKGTAMKDKKKRAAAGATASVSVATSASGNYDNAVEIAFENNAVATTNAANFSGGILGGAQSSFGTATSPARTTQTITAPVSAYHTSFNNNGQGNSSVHIGGIIRNNNFSSTNKEKWIVDANTILAQSFATGVVLTAVETHNNRDGIRDNTFGTNINGIYQNKGHGTSNGSGFYGLRIDHASGRGTNTVPQGGDSFTFRLSVSNVNGSSTLTAIHDVTVNFQ